jgi:hypothetical protein
MMEGGAVRKRCAQHRMNVVGREPGLMLESVRPDFIASRVTTATYL